MSQPKVRRHNRETKLREILGTFGGALEARHIDASNGKLGPEVTCQLEAEEGVVVIRRVQVATQLVASEETRDTVQPESARWPNREIQTAK